MYSVPNSESRLNLRVKPELKADLSRLADWHGLTLSSYAHSILVKAVRREKESLPELFSEKEDAVHSRELPPASANRLPLIEPEEGKKRRTA